MTREKLQVKYIDKNHAIPIKFIQSPKCQISLKILRQCSILAVIFWSVTYFGVFNFGTSYLGAKIKP
jgi:hypothetical protein